jgi:polar amino acid transport system substrate-binding protein
VIAEKDDVVDRVMKMIKEKRVDLYTDNGLVLLYVLHRLKLNDVLKIVRPCLEKKRVSMPFLSKKIASNKRQELISIWNDGRLPIKGKKEQLRFKKYNVTFKGYAKID